MDKLDNRLLDAIQASFPVTERPYEDLAVRLGVDGSEVVDRIARLKAGGVIREISAIFDSRALGYRSALVAFRVEEGRVDAIAKRVAAHAGVSHCYSRDGEYNLWFTLSLPPGGDLDAEAKALADEGVEAHLVLPALRTFKIGVFLPMSGGAAPVTGCRRVGGLVELSEHDRDAVRALQEDLPLVDRPFADLAAKHGLDEDDLLKSARSLLDRGAMRRYAAVLRHTNAGYNANAMICWLVDLADVEVVGRALAAHPAVGHCYERPASSEWPYALYTMVHARVDGELDRAIAGLSDLAGGVEHVVLRTVREYKKSRVRYFA